MKSEATKIALKYLLFAIMATLVNLSFQHLSFLAYDQTGALYLAMIMGTGAGLICKYVLDKKYIFYHTPENKSQDAKKFMLYTLTGVLTTFIFWGAEIGFDYFLKTNWAKYLGAVMGLSIGYIAKYQLDKHYVFNS